LEPVLVKGYSYTWGVASRRYKKTPETFASGAKCIL